jgi:hypothetical protein
MLLYDAARPRSCITMGIDTNVTANISIVAVSIWHEMGSMLAARLQASELLNVSLEGVVPSLFDMGSALLLGMAVGTVFLGGLWSGSDAFAARKRTAESAPLVSDNRRRSGSQHETMDLTPAAGGRIGIPQTPCGSPSKPHVISFSQESAHAF